MSTNLPAYPAAEFKGRGERTDDGESIGPAFGRLATLTGLPRLVARLRTEGCKVSRADDYLDRATLTPPAVPDVPAGLLDLTVQQFQSAARVGGIAAATITETRHRHDALRTALDDEMRQVMAAEVDDYLDVLRPAFTAAAAHARKVAELVTDPDEPLELIIARHGGAAAELVIAWRRLDGGTTGPAADLARLYALRAALADELDVGEGRGADHAVGVLNPYPGPDALKPRRKGEHRTSRWVRLAASLELRPFASLSQDDKLTAQGHDVAELRREAQRQAATEETTGALPAAVPA